MTTPTPANKHFTLYSVNAGTFTRHVYVGTRSCTTTVGDDCGPAWEHIYECEITGARRRFGIEDRKTPGNIAENN